MESPVLHAFGCFSVVMCLVGILGLVGLINPPVMMDWPKTIWAVIAFVGLIGVVGYGWALASGKR